MEANEFPIRRVVVGVDGSDHSRRALVLAMEDAERRRAALDVIHAWQVPTAAMPLGVPYEALNAEALAREAKALLERELDWAETHTTARPVLIRPQVVQGRASTVLTEASEGADLLVVGARGLGMLASFVLGSVSAFCVRHARVPVLVVHRAG
jgi:nucleotide-binding universal stress UspA family protein